MNQEFLDVIIKQLITYAIILPVAFIVLKLIFKKSIMFRISFLIVFFVLFVSLTTVIGQNLNGNYTFIITPVNVFVGYLTFSYINKVLRIPLGKSILQLQKLSEGNLNLKLEKSNSKDEIGVLANSIENLQSKLKEVISEVNYNAVSLANAGEEFSSTSEQLSQGAAGQASASEEVSATIEELSVAIDTNTSNSQEARNVSSEARKSISEVAEKSESLLKAVQEIAEKITIIEDIAGVTDILAVNASIQAANAGEHGKGFSVVAAEVRKLADKSRSAAEQIQALSKKGFDLSEENKKLISEILPKIENTSDLNDAIATASIQQNSGTQQVNSAIQELNDITQQNSASSEELLNSAESLLSQADVLKKTISFFKVEDDK